ncbi:MAG: sulfurtransferase, partial [Pseudomonadota bacterium]
MTQPLPSLVSTEWLAQELGAPDLVVLDASRHLPDAKRDPLAEYQAGHIPGARFMGLASLTDATSSVPAALPSPKQLSERLAELGVASDARIVLYDDSAVKTAARAWFTLKAFGIAAAILDGGLAKWRSEGRDLEAGLPEIAAAEPMPLEAAQGVATKVELLTNLDSNEEHEVLDARSADRVFGFGEDPVHGGQNGRIPGALNLPFGGVFDADGTYKSADDLLATFQAAGLDMTQPVVTSCGSGITASVLAFAL